MNNYIYINCINFHPQKFIEFKKKIEKANNFSEYLNDVIFITNSYQADIKIETYDKKIDNEKLKNIILHLYDNQIIDKNKIEIETNLGVYKIQKEEDNIFINVKKANITPRNIPVMTDKGVYLKEKIMNEKNEYYISSVSFNEAHTVLYLSDIYQINFEKLASYISNYRQFPQKTNVEIFDIVDYNTIRIRYYDINTKEAIPNYNAIAAVITVGVLNHYLNQEEIKIIGLDNEITAQYLNDDSILIKDKIKKEKSYKKTIS